MIMKSTNHLYIFSTRSIVWNDFFKAWWEKKALPSPRVIDDSILAEFLHRTSRWKDQIVVHQEDLNRTRWNGAPIEFLLIDAMKSAQQIIEETVAQFSPSPAGWADWRRQRHLGEGCWSPGRLIQPGSPGRQA